MGIIDKSFKRLAFPTHATREFCLDRLAAASNTDARITLKLARLAAAYCVLASYRLIYGQALFVMPWQA
ncbi:hypothetical protein GGE45_004126 [Rhizobium aethiopicum]|uniref:Uncharacterized protein n=1 Tax=Rhizobium aethiopicum TaxID=1138170 RepID=A0A7W6QEP7_9HYPH|nr:MULTISPECIES: hypothetical protein [Rhizobium]MBB4196176.1 hypothetical protein [Rhizobium aethiopicum]MBB4581773.1 hypothetical protein [Rhizobium aethiopicum]MDO3435686.1 hypothetical protein [Rhizobium sp. CBN3]